MYVTAVDGMITKSTNKYLPVDMARIHKSSSILCFVFLLNINVMYLAADNNCSIESREYYYWGAFQKHKYLQP